MFRRIADFEKTWAYESEQTLRVLRALTDASLAQRVAPQDRTLGRMAWHLAGSIGEMAGRTGLAITGVEHSVRDAISRIEAATQAALGHAPADATRQLRFWKFFCEHKETP